ncbi:hypothetical protein [Paraburkholderia bannensis]|uniref:hypothetical protein n=1 Tax=Paraburkholderia bannensis TaxID=765414 RepID=UPI002ABD7945|nr:hypothetical protein [Paraburkholderia bannensis]
MNNDDERQATSHTAVLDPDRRDKTGLKSGLISENDALWMAYYKGIQYSGAGFSAFTSLRLGNEITFYEVSFKGKIFRSLARPTAGQPPNIRPDDVQYELARSWAPGLKSAGWLLQPPTTVPNTPRALLAEMQEVLQTDAAEIVTNAYSILNYRRHNGAQYPDTTEPAGYRFDQIFLLRMREDGSVNCLYETPSGVSPEKWTFFLRDLDRPSARERLGRYLASGMAERDFGKDGAAAMRAAIILRHGALGSYDPLSFGHFMDVFKVGEYESKVERTVGGSRR